jgi:ribosomal protein L6P/L9E
MKTPFANLVKNFFEKKEKPTIKPAAVTVSLKPVDNVKKIFISPKGEKTRPYFESQQIALLRSKRKVRSRMQKHSRRVNFGLA